MAESNPDQSALLRIADLTIALAWSGDARLGFSAAKAKFLVGEGLPDVRIHATFGEMTEAPEGLPLFDAGSVWQLHRRGDARVFRFGSLALGPHPYKIAAFNEDFSAGDIRLDRDFLEPGQPVDPLWSPLDELLLGHLLGRGRGVEVHACGLIDAAGHGHLFVGRSGAGKTTMARLWQDVPGATVLSDDRIILRRRDDAIWMYGTPWHSDGGMAAPGQCPLTRIYFLARGRANALVPLRAADVAARLHACSFPPVYDREAVAFTLRFIEDITSTVPCGELRVLPDARVVEFIGEQVAGTR